MSLAQGNVQVQPGEVHALVHEAVQDGEVERPPEVRQVVANLRYEQTGVSSAPTPGVGVILIDLEEISWLIQLFDLF